MQAAYIDNSSLVLAPSFLHCSITPEPISLSMSTPNNTDGHAKRTGRPMEHAQPSLVAGHMVWCSGRETEFDGLETGGLENIRSRR